MKEKLIKAKEKVGKIWERNSDVVFVTGLSIASYWVGVYIGGKCSLMQANVGLNEVIKRYPDRPIKELEQAVFDTLAAVKAK